MVMVYVVDFFGVCCVGVVRGSISSNRVSSVCRVMG